MSIRGLVRLTERTMNGRMSPSVLKIYYTASNTYPNRIELVISELVLEHSCCMNW